LAIPRVTWVKTLKRKELPFKDCRRGAVVGGTGLASLAGLRVKAERDKSGVVGWWALVDSSRTFLQEKAAYSSSTTAAYILSKTHYLTLIHLKHLVKNKRRIV
jgi:hypothetical protein